MCPLWNFILFFLQLLSTSADTNWLLLVSTWLDLGKYHDFGQSMPPAEKLNSPNAFKCDNKGFLYKPALEKTMSKHTGVE